MDKSGLYNDLVRLYYEVYKEKIKTYQKANEEVSKLYKKLKSDKSAYPQNVQAEIRRLEVLQTQKKTINLYNYFVSVNLL